MTSQNARNRQGFADLFALLEAKGVQRTGQRHVVLDPPATTCEQRHWAHVRTGRSFVDCRLCRGVETSS